MAYQKQTWEDNKTIITAEMMAHIEEGIVAAEKATQAAAATKTTLGTVKQANAVADAAGETVSKAEFNALLAALRDAGILAKA